MDIKVKIERRPGGFVAVVTEKNGCWVNSSLDTESKKDEMTRPTEEEALGVLVHRNPRLFCISFESAKSTNGLEQVKIPPRDEERLERQNYE